MSRLRSLPASTGFVFGILAGLSFGSMGFLVHINSGHTPAAELVFLRALFGLAVLLPIVVRQIPKIFSRDAGFLWLRSIAGSTSMLCLYWTLQHTSVGRSTALSHLAPVFVVMLSWRFFGEKIALREAVAITLAMAGVAALFARDESHVSVSVAVIGITGAIGASVAYVSLRQAAAQFSPMLVIWTFSLVMMIFSLILPGPSWVVPARTDALAVFGVCATGLLGQVFLTLSYMYLRAPIASTLGLSSLVFGVACESLYYGKPPPGSELISYVLILLGVSLLQILRKSPARKESSPEFETAPLETTIS